MVEPTAAVSLIVPCRHERANVPRLHAELSAALTHLDWELIFVDDSDDATVEVLQALSEHDPRVRVLHRPVGERDGGLGGAVIAGLQMARSSTVLVMDADLQHPPTAVPTLLAPLLSGQADVVVGSRYTGDGSAAGLAGLHRTVVSRVCRQLVQTTFPRTRGTTDPLGGFFALDARILRETTLRPEGYKILLEVLVRAPWSRIVDVPFTFAPRAGEESKSGLAEGRRFLRHVRQLRDGSSARPRRTAAIPLPRSLSKVSAPALPAPRPLNVLILTSEAPPVVSGISTTVAGLTEGLSALGHGVDVVSRRDFPHWMRREMRVSSFGAFWPSVRRHLRSFDVVNVHGPVPTLSDVFLLLAATLGGERPAVVYTHHSDLNIPGLRLACSVYNAATRRLAQRADAVVVSSEDYRDRVQVADGAPVAVVPWGVETSGRVQERPAPATSDLRVLFVGQLRPYKGLAVLLEAVGGVRGLQLQVVGDGSLREELEGSVRDSGTTNVRFSGRLPDAGLWQAYAESDVVVLPSTTTAEAYGLVLVEGMAAGCVPVASDLPGVREVAERSGIVVPTGDATALREALLGLHRDRDDLADRSRRSAALGSGSARTTALAYERVLRDAVTATTVLHARQALPPGWSRPATVLERLEEELELEGCSLVLLRRHGASALLWRPTDDDPRRVPRAPVAGWAARRGLPLHLSTVHRGPVALRPFLQRKEISSSLLLPLTRSAVGSTVLCLSSATAREFDVAQVRAVIAGTTRPARRTARTALLAPSNHGALPVDLTLHQHRATAG